MNTPSKPADHAADAAGKPLPTLAETIIDRRTREWRRRRELIAAFVAALGGRSAIPSLAMAKVEAAADLAVVAEVTRLRFLAGDAGVTADDLVRTANMAARAERALGIGQRSTRPTGPDLRGYLAAKAQAAA